MCVCVCASTEKCLYLRRPFPTGLILFLNQLFLAPVTLVDTRLAAESFSVQAQKKCKCSRSGVLDTTRQPYVGNNVGRPQCDLGMLQSGEYITTWRDSIVAFSIRAHLSVLIFWAHGKAWLKLECSPPKKVKSWNFSLPAAVKRWEIRFLRSATTPSAPAQHFVCACPSQGLCIFYKATHFLISLTPWKSRFLLIRALIVYRAAAKFGSVGPFGHAPHCFLCADV